MNKICRLVVAWGILLSLLLTSCAAGGSSGSSDPSADKTCQEGVCAEIDIAQPIALNQPANVTITISSTVNKPDLLVHLEASPTNVAFGPDTDWRYDAVANQSQAFHSTVTFTSAGEFMIAAQVYMIGGPLVENFERVLIDSKGAVVNPTINPNPTSDLFIASTPPPPEALTATAKANPTLIEPTKPPVEGFTAQQWFEKCGWTVKKLDTLSLWPDVSGYLDIKETAIVGEPVTGTLMIGFKDDAHPDVPIQARIGLCTLGRGWTNDTSHEWSTELRSARPFATPVSLRFTDIGEQPIFIVALDTKNNRIAGIGRLIYVKPKEQSSVSLATPSAMDNTKSDGQAGIMAVLFVHISQTRSTML